MKDDSPGVLHSEPFGAIALVNRDALNAGGLAPVAGARHFRTKRASARAAEPRAHYRDVHRRVIQFYRLSYEQAGTHQYPPAPASCLYPFRRSRSSSLSLNIMYYIYTYIPSFSFFLFCSNILFNYFVLYYFREKLLFCLFLRKDREKIHKCVFLYSFLRIFSSTSA